MALRGDLRRGQRIVIADLTRGTGDLISRKG